MSYIGNEPIVSATRTVTEVTATAGQTVFTANGGYTVGFLDVFINGSKLTSADFTATDGSTVTLTEAAQVSDIVRLEALGIFLASNGVAKTGDTMTGVLSINGQLVLTTQTTSNADFPLQIVRSGTNKQALHTYTTSGGTNWYTGHDNDGTNNFYIGSDLNFPSIQVDTSGRVKMPSQPAFFASYKSGSYLTSPQTPLLYNSVLLNRGSHYNSSTGRFTAPVAGVYRFEWCGIGNSSNQTVARWNLLVNGSYLDGYSELRLDNNGVALFPLASRAVMVSLNQNDYVTVAFGTDNGGSVYADASNNWIYFSGQLIG